MQSEWKFVVYSWLFEGIFWKFWLHPACIPDIRSDFYDHFTQLLNIARDDVNPELNTLIQLYTVSHLINIQNRKTDNGSQNYTVSTKNCNPRQCTIEMSNLNAS